MQPGHIILTAPACVGLCTMSSPHASLGSQAQHLHVGCQRPLPPFPPPRPLQVCSTTMTGEHLQRLCQNLSGFVCAWSLQDCTNGDPYYGYGGALKCMMDHEDRVAFVKHTTADDEGADKV